MTEPLPAYERHLRHHLSECRKRAKAKGLLCDLTYRDLLLAYRRSGGKCEISRHPFCFGAGPRERASPWSMSIDRRDPTVGYTKKNIRIVSLIVNYAMRDWGDRAVRELGYFVGKRLGGTFPEKVEAVIKMGIEHADQK